MPRWSAKHKKALAKLFESGVADPESTKADDIDPIYSIDPVFKDVTTERFRDNYKNCATEWMAGKALDGVRRADFKTDEKEVDVEETEEIEDSIDVKPDVKPILVRHFLMIGSLP